MTDDSSLCLASLVEAIKMKCEKYLSLLVLTTDTVKSKPYISAFLNSINPYVLCSIFSIFFSALTVFDTCNLSAFRGETKLKVTSDLFYNLNEKSILCSSSSIE